MALISNAMVDVFARPNGAIYVVRHGSDACVRSLLSAIFLPPHSVSSTVKGALALRRVTVRRESTRYSSNYVSDTIADTKGFGIELLAVNATCAIKICLSSYCGVHIVVWPCAGYADGIASEESKVLNVEIVDYFEAIEDHAVEHCYVHVKRWCDVFLIRGPESKTNVHSLEKL